jgi:hypothetical protein
MLCQLIGDLGVELLHLLLQVLDVVSVVLFGLFEFLDLRI